MKRQGSAVGVGPGDAGAGERVGAGLSRALASPGRLTLMTALDALGGEATYDALVDVTGVPRGEVRAALRDLEDFGLVVRTCGGEARARIAERGRWVLSDHWDALRALRSDLLFRAGRLAADGAPPCRSARSRTARLGPSG